MKGEPTVSIAAGNLRAEFWSEAGMLGTSLRYRGEELLRRIDDLDSAKQKGSTAGIPLLYPWANRLAALHYRAAGQNVQLNPSSPLLHFDEHGLPMHGVPWCQLKWALVERNDNSLLARLDWNRPELLSAFPFPHKVELAAVVESDSLTLQTVVSANSGSPVPVSFGFHPYFGIPHAPRSQWRLRTPPMRKFLLDSRGIPSGAQEPFGPLNTLLGDSGYDDGFALLEGQSSFVLSGENQSISVDFLEGFPFAQVFAPGGKEFIALEPMTAPTSALTSGHGLRILESGGQFRASFSIAVQRI
jgi:aldose 1-epimerase